MIWPAIVWKPCDNTWQLFDNIRQHLTIIWQHMTPLDNHKTMMFESCLAETDKLTCIQSWTTIKPAMTWQHCDNLVTTYDTTWQRYERGVSEMFQPETETEWHTCNCAELAGRLSCRELRRSKIARWRPPQHSAVPHNTLQGPHHSAELSPPQHSTGLTTPYRAHNTLTIRQAIKWQSCDKLWHYTTNQINW